MAVSLVEIGTYSSFDSPDSTDVNWAYYQIDIPLDGGVTVRKHDSLLVMLGCALATNQLPYDPVFGTYGSVSDLEGNSFALELHRYGGITGLSGDGRSIGLYRATAAAAFTGGGITIACRDTRASPVASLDKPFLVKVYRARDLGALLNSSSNETNINPLTVNLFTNGASRPAGSVIGLAALAWEHNPSGGETLDTSGNGTATDLVNYAATTTGRTTLGDGMGGSTEDRRDLAAAIASAPAGSGAFTNQGYRGTLTTTQTAVRYVGVLGWWGEEVVVPGGTANLETPFRHYVRVWTEEDALLSARSDGVTPPFTGATVTVDAGPAANPDLYLWEGRRIYLLYEFGGNAIRRFSDDDGATWGATDVAFTGGTYPRAAVDPLSRTVVEFALVGGVLKARRRTAGESRYSAEFTPTGLGTIEEAAFGASWAYDDQRRLLLAINNGTQIVEYESTDDGNSFTVVP